MNKTIQKRAQECVRKAKEEWCQQWMDYIELHPEHPWDLHVISQHKNLTMEYVERHPEHPWKWDGISCNEFKKEKNAFIEKKSREHIAAFKIQQWFYSIKLNPKYSYCRKQVNMFYDTAFAIM